MSHDPYRVQSSRLKDVGPVLKFYLHPHWMKSWTNSKICQRFVVCILQCNILYLTFFVVCSISETSELKVSSRLLYCDQVSYGLANDEKCTPVIYGEHKLFPSSYLPYAVSKDALLLVSWAISWTFQLDCDQLHHLQRFVYHVILLPC